ncbi:MAG: hypothetical protein E3J87_03845 [Candidatus Cloacimonadota bacterium]|nr:MAG: hypothetical protein E3J87_03845 [Candidatus Cloacimonadota bacterium]
MEEEENLRKKLTLISSYDILFSMRNFLFLLLLLLSCSRDYPIFSPHPGYFFPLAVGNQWNYIQTSTITNYPEQGDTFLFPSDTIHWEIKGRKVIRRWNTYILQEDEYYFTQYYANLEDGFYQLAYSISNSTHSYNPYKGKYKIRFKERTFNNIKELEIWIMNLGNFSKRDTLPLLDSLIHDIRKMLSYPPEVGDEWTFFNYPWYAVREIIDIEEVETETGNFLCWKTRTLYDIDNDGILDSDIYWDEYYSDEGIIKRYFWLLIDIIDKNGVKVGEGEVEDILLLKDYNIILP